MGSGASGPSVDDLMKNWETHTVKEERRLTFAGFVKRCLWGLLIIILSVAIGFVCLKGCAVWAVGVATAFYRIRSTAGSAGLDPDI